MPPYTWVENFKLVYYTTDFELLKYIVLYEPVYQYTVLYEAVYEFIYGPHVRDTFSLERVRNFISLFSAFRVSSDLMLPGLLLIQKENKVTTETWTSSVALLGK